MKDRLPDWSGEPCIMVASGPTARLADLTLSRGRARHIAVNTSFRLCPWADLLYAADYTWWRAHRSEVAGFAGLKVGSAGLRHAGIAGGVELEATEAGDGFSREPGRVAHLGNSGAQALNLALLMGCRRIVLVGYDMRSRFGLHWHAPHAGRLANPGDELLAGWAARLDAAAPGLADFGAEVVNASVVSALRAFRKMPFEEALRWLTT